MTRALIVSVVALALAGCATSVDDPLPAPKAGPEPKDPPAETFSGELQHQGSIYDYVIKDEGNLAVPEIDRQPPPNLPGR